MAKTKDSETYSPKEAQRRFEAALRGARVAGHKSKENMTPKRPRPQHHFGKIETKPTKTKKSK